MSILMLAGPLVLPAKPALPPCPDYMSSFKTELFDVRYNPNSIGSPSLIVDASIGAYDDVTSFFGSYPYVTTLEIAADHNEYRILTGIGDAPEAVKADGWNEGDRGVVVIKAPALLPDYRQVLAHQLARMAERTMMTSYRSAPEWFQEGLASYVAGDLTAEQRQLARSQAASEGWMTLDELESVNRNATIYNADDPRTVAARAQSCTLVDHIGRKYGNQKLLGILKDYCQSGDFSRAFSNQTAQEPGALNEELKEMLAAPAATPVRPGGGEGSIYGFLHDSAGRSLAGQLIVFTGPGSTVNVTTDEEGHFDVSVRPGTYQVQVPGLWLTADDPVVVRAGEFVEHNISATSSTATAQPTPSTNASVVEQLPLALIVGLNLAVVIAVIVILRRNWP